MRGPAPKPRPFCAHCKVQRVKELRCRFCSETCAGLAKTKKRPLCAWCRVTPIKLRRATAKYCSKGCAALAQRSWRIPLLREGWKKAQATMQAKYFERANAFIGLQVDALVDRLGLPGEQRDEARAHFRAVFWAVYRRAYALGYQRDRTQKLRGRAA